MLQQAICLQVQLLRSYTDAHRALAVADWSMMPLFVCYDYRKIADRHFGNPGDWEESDKMGEYITGVLIRSAPGAQYAGAIYDRWLTVQHSSGVTLKIFDPFPPISSELVVGVRYQVIISALVPIEVAVFAGAPPKLPEGWWQGTIRELEWRAGPLSAYQHAQTEISHRSWLLVETQVGSLLMEPRRVCEAVPVEGRTDLQVGDVVHWYLTRLDLQDVV